MPEHDPNASVLGPNVVVGIGASAGALDALERFFSAVPPDPGAVFVVVQHLERHRPSVLAELLAKYTRMPVEQAEDGVRALSNHVYIIPPNAMLTFEKGILRVCRPTELGPRAPIDAFLCSLARDQGENAIGIIVSGAGSDGTAGLRAIKENGGLALAQTPASAKYDSMPQSAIAAGLVDFTLPVEQMPSRIKAYAQRLTEIRRKGAEALDTQVAANLGSICRVLQQNTGHDFSRYKQGTLVRRIRRRLQLQQMASVPDYVRYLTQEPAEADLLHKDLLIGVTHFFRDRDAFNALAEHVLPTIFASVCPGSAVRIWVAGCASGEEAYSIAILFREYLAREGRDCPVQIFATDIDDEVLAIARQGRYPERIQENVSPERLERFFARDGESYRVTRAIREMCTFSEHSLIKDPPFSSLDLISCRNVLIYLGNELQRKLVPLFHYALRSSGHLLLGPSESLAAHTDLFITLDPKHRLFRRNDVVVRPAVDFPLSGRGAWRMAQQSPSQHETTNLVSPQMFSLAFERMVLEEYCSPCAVINERGDILYSAGRIGRYLQVPAGAPTNNALDLAQGALRVEMRSALAKAAEKQRKAVRDNVVMDLDGRPHRLRLTIRPLPGVAHDAGLYALVLQDMGTAEDLDAEDVASEPGPPLVEQLENELRTIRADLQAAMEELESSNEELKSSNEELISTNEELQSANEELETSREELQSANDELHSKVQEFDAVQSDLQHHLAGTQVATVFLDKNLRILRFTPPIAKLFHFIEGDIGRPIRDLAPGFVEEDLLPAIEIVLKTDLPVERHVHKFEGPTWFLMRIRPHRARDGVVTGVGITFVDVTDFHRAEEAERRYDKLLLLSPDAVLIWSFQNGIETWNQSAEQLYGFGVDEARGKAPRDLVQAVYPCPWSDIESALREGGRWDGEVECHAKDGRRLTISAKLIMMRGEDGIDRIIQSDRDVTQRKDLERERERLIQMLRQADQRKNEFLAMLSHELRNPLTPIRNSLHILERAELGTEQGERAKAVINRQVLQLTRLIDDLLDVTRITQGKIQIQFRRLELGELLRRTVEDYHPTLANAGLELDVHIPDAPLWAKGDPARLAQAIGNVLSNAAKFTPPGGHVLVSLEKELPSNMAAIRIQDDGVGIVADLQTRIFEPFEQGTPSLDHSRGGLGLGLALVKGLIEGHGGQGEASSGGPGKGATFTIRLHLEESPALIGDG